MRCLENLYWGCFLFPRDSTTPSTSMALEGEHGACSYYVGTEEYEKPVHPS
jgi:hypothetical protein